MLRRRLVTWELVGFGVVCLLGSLGHFVYGWSGENRAVGAFFAVNESTWEHMKLLYIPYVCYLIAECFSLAREMENFLAAKAAGAALALAAIPVSYYALGGMFGALPHWSGIVIFFCAAALAFWVSCRVMRRDRLRGIRWQIAGFLLLWALLLAFVWWTYHPPHLPLFQDSVTGLYGIAA